ncbi:Dabb family protein [Paraburkholderia sp.]|uniref:Dabb family protein n=1 Tax=Paraburkholderia sp. TaxID=1926495 RepID=UPI002D5432DB|nr:Dabb family protein [Paraburkholderia sp.]HZZ05007.1 Dabb family protein [Paraburkholderia sp.]
MQLETAQLYLEDGACQDTLERELDARAHLLPGLCRIVFGRNMEGCWGAGDYTVDLHIEADTCDVAATAYLTQLPGVLRADHLAYRPLDGGQRAAGLQNGVWRTLLFRVRPEACSEHVAALERDLLRMPAYMPTIRNWQLSRVTSQSAWSHVWQQEFACVEDLQGAYLTHPFHWGWVDRWFDPEFPEWTVAAISHAFCPLESSVLTLPAITHRSI